MKIPEQKFRPPSQYYSTPQLKKNKNTYGARIRSAPRFIIAIRSHIHINSKMINLIDDLVQSISQT